MAERKAATPLAAASAGTTTTTPGAFPPAPTTTLETPPPPPPHPAVPPAVSASFARSNPWTDLSSPMDARQRLLLLCLGVPLLLWRLCLTALILPCVHGAFCALVAGQDLGAPLSPLRARCTNALLRCVFLCINRSQNRGGGGRAAALWPSVPLLSLSLSPLASLCPSRLTPGLAHSLFPLHSP